MSEQEMVSKAEAKLMSHEAVCAERYNQMCSSLEKGDKRMTKIEYLLYVVMVIVLLGPGAGAEFFKKLFHLDVDPLTLLAMANGAVAAVKKGCQLYKDIKSAAGDVSAVLKDIDKQFAGRKVTKAQAEKIAEKKAEFKEAATTDPNDVISRIGNQLGDFFDAFDKIEQLFYEEERHAMEVYEGTDSVSKRALQRVLIRSRLQIMQQEIKEQMIYHSPPELKDLWTRFEDMRAQIGREQKRAWEALRIQRQQEAAAKRQLNEFWWGIGGWLAAVMVVWVYVMLLLWAIVRHREGSLSMVGNVIMMIVLLAALTFGGFLYMDYLSEREQNKVLSRKIEAVKRIIAGCQKE